MLLAFILPEVVNEDGQFNQSAFLTTLYMPVGFSAERRLTHEWEKHLCELNFTHFLH